MAEPDLEGDYTDSLHGKIKQLRVRITELEGERDELFHRANKQLDRTLDVIAERDKYKAALERIKALSVSEEMMVHWEYIRKACEDYPTASMPRDMFENNVLDGFNIIATTALKEG